MKVIFLDVDGVLNSEPYFMEHLNDMRQNPIDPEGVRRLERIVSSTGAQIVLSSSWRGGWDRDPDKMDIDGQVLTENLSRYGLTIYDKTDYIEFGRRAREIKAWLKASREKVESFVILDDCNYAWDKHGLGKRWVRTEYIDGGLLDEDVDKAIAILNRKFTIAEKMELLLSFSNL